VSIKNTSVQEITVKVYNESHIINAGDEALIKINNQF
jgi:hypothetical protein